MEKKVLQGKNIDLVVPSLADHRHVQGIWEDPETMADVGGIFPISAEEYTRWWRYMFVEKKDQNMFFLIMDRADGTCLGEVSFHRYDRRTGRAMFNIKVKKSQRGRGIGREAMDLALAYFFQEWKGEVMQDDLWDRNRNGIETLKKYGFHEADRNTGREGEEVLLEMTRRDWERRRAAEQATDREN